MGKETKKNTQRIRQAENATVDRSLLLEYGQKGSDGTQLVDTKSTVT
ncbi:hypothetical protein [Phocaeicola vulgatus]|nr:hypothetical protein [Phocaeicola vulgatus]MCG4726072.1 hypothetical protein [Phocaeicola vulgatus]